MLISDSRFDLVWFRLSCDHGWIRSGSVNVRKQQQQHTHAELDGRRDGRPQMNHSKYRIQVCNKPNEEPTET